MNIGEHTVFGQLRNADLFYWHGTQGTCIKSKNVASGNALLLESDKPIDFLGTDEVVYLGRPARGRRMNRDNYHGVENPIVNALLILRQVEQGVEVNKHAVEIAIKALELFNAGG